MDKILEIEKKEHQKELEKDRKKNQKNLEKYKKAIVKEIEEYKLKLRFNELFFDNQFKASLELFGMYLKDQSQKLNGLML